MLSEAGIFSVKCVPKFVCFFTMCLRVLLLAVAMASVHCLDRARLQKCPPPQKAFDVNSYVGDWYMKARLPSCSWAGASEFNNHRSSYSKQPSGNIYMKDTWRNGVCAGSIFDLKPEQPSGVYALKDPIGNVISGKSVVVATDYTNFAIKWGCTKFIGEICTDAYVVLKTRHMELSPKTWKIVSSILDKMWGMGMSEMLWITHDKNACAPVDSAGKLAAPTIQPISFKTY